MKIDEKKSKPSSPQSLSPAESVKSEAESFNNVEAALTPPPSSISSSPPPGLMANSTLEEIKPETENNDKLIKGVKSLNEIKDSQSKEYVKNETKINGYETCETLNSNQISIPQGLPQRQSKSLTSFLIDDILKHTPKGSHSSLSSFCSKSSKKSANYENRSCINNKRIVRPWDLKSSSSNSDCIKSKFEKLHRRIAYFKSTGIHHSRHLISPERLDRMSQSADDDSRSDRSDQSQSPASPSSDLDKPGLNNSISSPLDALFEMTSKTLEGLNNNDKLGGQFDFYFFIFCSFWPSRPLFGLKINNKYKQKYTLLMLF